MSFSERDLEFLKNVGDSLDDTKESPTETKQDDLKAALNDMLHVLSDTLYRATIAQFVALWLRGSDHQGFTSRLRFENVGDGLLEVKIPERFQEVCFSNFATFTAAHLIHGGTMETLENVDPTNSSIFDRKLNDPQTNRSIIGRINSSDGPNGKLMALRISPKPSPLP